MTKVLLSLSMPSKVAQQVEDLLLSRPDLVQGFTTSEVAGHGSAVQLVEPAELVSGHAPRTQINIVGAEDALRAVLALIKADLPHANLFYWLTPVIEAGRL